MRQVYGIVSVIMTLTVVCTPVGAEGVEKLIDAQRLGEAGEALAAEVRRDGESGRTLFLEAMILRREGRFQESNGVLERSLRLAPESGDAWKLAGLNLVSLGHEVQSEPYFARAVELAPDDFMARYYLGMALLTQNQAEPAESELRHSLRLNPAHLDAWCVLGLALERQGKPEEALRTYRLAIKAAGELGAGAAMPHLYLGRYLVGLQRFEEAAPELDAAAAGDPQNGEALRLLGQASAGGARRGGHRTAGTGGANRSEGSGRTEDARRADRNLRELLKK